MRSSQQIWALKSLKVAPSNNRHFITQTSSPMEAKRGGLEIMTIPVSRNNPENFSGEGKDLNEDSYPIPKGPLPSLSAEDEKDAGGSGGKDLPFTHDSQMKGSDDHGIPLETTVKWQLTSLQTTQPTGASSSSEPKHVEPASTAEEARGEIAYVHRPIEKRKNNPLNKVNVPFVKRKQDVELTRAPEVHTYNMPTTSSPVVPSEDKLAITSTARITTFQSGDETTTEDILCTPDPSVSSTWLPVVQEEVDTPQPKVRTIPTTQAGPMVQPTSPDPNNASHQAESRSGGSESFVAAHGWITSKLVPMEEPSSQTTGNPEKDTTNSPSRSSGKSVFSCVLLVEVKNLKASSQHEQNVSVLRFVCLMH